MEHLSVQAALRGKQTRGELTRKRQSGQIPVSISGKGMDPVSLYLSASDISRILHAKTGRNTLVDVVFEGGRHVARLANVERDPIKNTIITVSLQKIATGEPQKATIGLNIVGEPAAVRDATGMLSTTLDHLEVRALPEKMVASLVVDTSSLAVGDVVRAGDITLPEGFDLLTDPDALIVSLQPAVDMAAELDAEIAADAAAVATETTQTEDAPAEEPA